MNKKIVIGSIITVVIFVLTSLNIGATEIKEPTINKQILIEDDRCPCEYEVSTFNPLPKFSFLRWFMCSILYFMCVSNCIDAYKQGRITYLMYLGCLDSCESLYDLCLDK